MRNCHDFHPYRHDRLISFRTVNIDGYLWLLQLDAEMPFLR